MGRDHFGRVGFLNDPGGKPSFGRLMICIAVLILITAAGADNEELTKVGETLLTTFLGWEARKHHDKPTDTQ